MLCIVGAFPNQGMVYYIAVLTVLLIAVGMCFLFAKYRKLHTNQRLVSRNGDSSNVNELGEINVNIYIYDEINDLVLDESHEMCCLTPTQQFFSYIMAITCSFSMK
jgi:hypothetical protein